MIFVDQRGGKTVPTLNYTNRHWAITIPRGDGSYEKGQRNYSMTPSRIKLWNKT